MAFWRDNEELNLNSLQRHLGRSTRVTQEGTILQRPTTMLSLGFQPLQIQTEATLINLLPVLGKRTGTLPLYLVPTIKSQASVVPGRTWRESQSASRPGDPRRAPPGNSKGITKIMSYLFAVV